MVRVKVNYSRGLILVMAIAVAAAVSLSCQNRKFQKLELLTLDLRFLLNSVTPPADLDYDLVVGKGGSYQLVKMEESDLRKKGSGIVFINAEEAASGGGVRLTSIDCSTAIKILTVWGAKAVVLSTILPQPVTGDDLVAIMGAVTPSSRVYMPALFMVRPDRVEDLYAGEGVERVIEPWDPYQVNAAPLGHITGIADIDGKLRRVPAVIRHKGKAVYQMGLRVALDAMGASDRDIEFDPARHVIAYSVPKGPEGVIPLDSQNRIMINWAAIRPEAAEHIPFRDLMESYRLTQYGVRPSIDPQAIKGKICMIGTAASNRLTGAPEYFRGYVPPGASALVIRSVFDDAFIRLVPRSVDIVLIVLVSLIYGSALASTRVLHVMMMAVIGIALLSVSSIYAVPKGTAILLTVFLSVPLGFFFARFRLLSGFLFTVMSIICYLMVSAGVFKFFNIAIVTFYPVLAILLIFLTFYAYTRLASYLRNVRLFNLATKDGLTSLCNRRHLNVLLDAELESAVLHKGRKLSVIMCDIDNFKKLNDTYGHQAGDAILRDFARIMKTKCRQSDVVGRYGGEEFLIMLHGAGAADALRVAEKIRQAIADRKFAFKDQPYSTSLSIGLVEYTHEKTKEELIEKADQALYRAKREGKNRVCVFGK